MMGKADYESLAGVIRRQWLDARQNAMQIAVDELEKLVFAIIANQRANNPRFTHLKEHEFIRLCFGAGNEYHVRTKWGHDYTTNRNGN